MEKQVPYVHWRTVPFGDTDPAGIVYTPRFSDYCMEAAEVFFRDYIAADWYHINTKLGFGTPVVQMEITFKAPLVANDRLGVVVRILDVGRSTVTMALEGIKERPQAAGHVTAFVGRYVFCFVEKGKGSMPIPSGQRELIEAYLASNGKAELGETGRELIG